MQKVKTKQSSTKRICRVKLIEFPCLRPEHRIDGAIKAQHRNTPDNTLFLGANSGIVKPDSSVVCSLMHTHTPANPVGKAKGKL